MSGATVAVRELCEFTAKRGDLDHRFTPAPSALEGIAGHAEVARRRGTGYRRELRLETEYRELRLRGRADGLHENPLTLEEIKTHRGDVQRLGENQRQLHWSQLKIYGAQLCEQQQLPALRLALVYFDIDRETETVLLEEHSAATLREFYERHCEIFLRWHTQEQVHNAARNRALAALAFPYADFHSGQRQLAEGVYRRIARGQSLLAQAPTGIGKSVGTLYPALKAMARGHSDKIFFLTAKTSGREAALAALRSLTKDAVLPLRILELAAREKTCVYPGRSCHGDDCPLARGFYDRLPRVREAAVALGLLDQPGLGDLARQHQVCPYYLSQELVRWSDVVVCDYNYYFDRGALLHELAAINDWRVTLLVDEAHNLVARAQAMYSGELGLRQLPTTGDRRVKRAAAKLRRRVRALVAGSEAEARFHHSELPGGLLDELQALGQAIGAQFSELPGTLPPEVLRPYFDLLHFTWLAERFGKHALFEVRATDMTLSIRNVVPAHFLRSRFKAASSSIAFSATLAPARYFIDMSGAPAESAWMDVDAPFVAGQLDVSLVTSISTRYHERPLSLRPIADLIAAQFYAEPGNYLAFFSSFDYLEAVAEFLRAHHPALTLWPQRRKMNEIERGEYLERFSESSRGVGLAVLGGAFAEGIDLPGRRLIGAFIATLGLPQVNPLNLAMRERMGRMFGAERAYDYSFLYPGLQKVVQAAGRVIRERGDRGVLYLIDDRFGRPEVRALLPRWWRPHGWAKELPRHTPVHC